MEQTNTTIPDWALDPSEFVRRLSNLPEGWSEEFGGPLGVARHTVTLQQRQAQNSEAIASVRAAAIDEAARTMSGYEIVQALGISRQAVEKARRRTKWRDARW